MQRRVIGLELPTRFPTEPAFKSHARWKPSRLRGQLEPSILPVKLPDLNRSVQQLHGPVDQDYRGKPMIDFADNRADLLRVGIRGTFGMRLPC